METAQLEIAPGRRKRGRPAIMDHEQMLTSIRDLARRPTGLYRVHLTHSDVYARARRMFGSWAAAVAAAGEDYERAIESARRRSLETRKRPD
jgi:hypothetical protein